MGKGLAFLNLKFFHPGNRDNQQRKWEALQREAQEQKRQRERELELNKEKELTEYRLKLLEQGTDKHLYQKELKKSQVSFLYNEPPGLKKQLEKERNKLEDEQRQKEWHNLMQNMTRDERRLAEKEMEQGLSIHERNAKRFEFLKNAPVAADYVKDMEVQHKPFGKVVRHVKCFKCNEWGHRIGDRECPESNHFFNKYAIKNIAPPKYKNNQNNNNIKNEKEEKKENIIKVKNEFKNEKLNMSDGEGNEWIEAPNNNNDSSSDSDKDNDNTQIKTIHTKENREKLLLREKERITVEDPINKMKGKNNFNPFINENDIINRDNDYKILGKDNRNTLLNLNSEYIENNISNRYKIKNLERSFNRDDLILDKDETNKNNNSSDDSSIDSEDERFIQSLNTKQKLKLLQKLQKRKEKKKSKKHKKKKHKSKHSKHKKHKHKSSKKHKNDKKYKSYNNNDNITMSDTSPNDNINDENIIIRDFKSESRSNSRNISRSRSIRSRNRSNSRDRDRYRDRHSDRHSRHRYNSRSRSRSRNSRHNYSRHSYSRHRYKSQSRSYSRDRDSRDRYGRRRNRSNSRDDRY